MDDDDLENGPPPGADASAYKVGYKTPPKHTQFQKGQSGNPGGRRRLPQRPPVSQPGALLKEILQKEVTLTVDGRRQTIRIDEALLMKVVQAALQGEARAQRLLFMHMRYWPMPQDEPAERSDATYRELMRRLDAISQRRTGQA